MDLPNDKIEESDSLIQDQEHEVLEAPEINKSDFKEVPEKEKAAIADLGEDIESAYSSLETRFASLWKSASEGAQNLQDKMNIEERKSKFLSQLNSAKENINNSEAVQNNLHSLEGQLKDLGEQVKNFEAGIDFKSISSQANKALDTLDSKLEGIELQAGRFVSLFTSFFSSIVQIDTPNTPEVKEAETLFSTSAVSNSAYGSTRYDTDLFKLHTSESRFLECSIDDEEELKVFDVESKTSEIASLLKTYPDTLEKLMNQIVPVKIAYNVFWYRYFQMESELKASEQKRKQLLYEDNSKSKATENEGNQEEEEEEEFTWDDEDDEEADAARAEVENA